MYTRVGVCFVPARPAVILVRVREEIPMRYICILLGLLTGKWKVKCIECRNLDAQGKCYGHKMPETIIRKDIACGFWAKKPG
jgi:hypothetical protein